MSRCTFSDEAGVATRVLSRSRPTSTRERTETVHCADCGTEFRMTGPHSLRVMREEGWRYRSTGDGIDWECVTVCGECADPECW